jgi:hypothetical protein
MNQQERIMVGEKWLAVAQMFSRELNQVALKMLLDSVSDLDCNKVCESLDKWVRTSKLGRHPYPAEIREMVNPTLDSDSKGKLAASRVVEAVSRFGYSNQDDARKFIGELGWDAVRRFGGWQYVCENLGATIQLSTFQAQVRDICTSTDKAALIGMSNSPIQISYSENRIGIESKNPLQKLDLMTMVNSLKKSSEGKLG